VSETGVRPKIGWIVALVGMLVVPLGGLVWAAASSVSSGGPDETAEEEIAAEDEDGTDGTGTTTPSKKKKKSAKKKTKKTKKGTSTVRGAQKATHELAGCCEALRTAGREDDDISKRPTFLAAASACEAAPTAARAKTQVRSIVLGSRAELPAACSDE
jgi:hypothetical protein